MRNLTLVTHQSAKAVEVIYDKIDGHTIYYKRLICSESNGLFAKWLIQDVKEEINRDASLRSNEWVIRAQISGKWLRDSCDQFMTPVQDIEIEDISRLEVNKYFSPDSELDGLFHKAFIETDALTTSGVLE